MLFSLKLLSKSMKTSRNEVKLTPFCFKIMSFCAFCAVSCANVCFIISLPSFRIDMTFLRCKYVIKNEINQLKIFRVEKKMPPFRFLSLVIFRYKKSVMLFSSNFLNGEFKLIISYCTKCY